MITANQPHYYIQPDSIDIRYAEYAGHHRFTVGLREGSSVLVYYPGLDTLGYRDDGSYLSFKLEGAGNRYLKSLDNNRYYIYICFPRTFKAYGDTAYLAFLPTWIPITEDAPGPPVSEKARELMQDNIYICIGTFYSDDSYDLDTGALGAIAQQNAWQEKLNDVPMRIDVTYVLAGGSALPHGETPHVDWGGNVTMTARLLQEWATDVTRLVDHWSIVRNSGDNVSDAAWNATATFDGEKTLLFNQTQNDLGTTGEKTEFTLTAYAADDSVLAIRTVLVTHTDMQAWIVDCDAPIGAINVDSLGNVKGGLWTEEEDDGDDDDSLNSEESETPMYRTYRLTLAVTVRRNALKGNDYLTIAADGQAPGPGEFQIYPQEGDCQLMVKNSTLYVTAINHIKDGVPGSGDEIWDDEEYKNMREMRYAEAAFIVNCEGLAAIPKTYRICINHDAAPYVAVEMAPATAEVTFDEKYINNNYHKPSSSFSGLPIPISLAAKFDKSPVKITGLVLGLDGMAPREGFTYQLSYHQSADPSDPLNGSIDGASITSLPKPDAARSLIGNYIVYLSLTAIYAGVQYERVMQFPIVERYKQVTVTGHVRHFLLTAVDDWSSYPGSVPPKTSGAWGTWTTDASQAKVSEQQPYLWVYDDTNYSNGKVDSTTPQLMGNWAEDAVTYYINVSLPVLTTDADGTLKAGQSTITVTPYVRRGTGLPQRINTAGFQLVQTLYNPDGTQRAGTAQKPNPDARSSVDGSDFYVTWNTIDALGHITYELKDSSGNLLCPVASVPYIADGADGDPGADVWAADLSNEMDSIHTTDGGKPTVAQSITTVAKLYEGSTEKTFTLIAVKRNGTAMTASAFAWEDTGLTVSISDGTITIAYTTEATISGVRDVFTFTLQNGTTTRDKSLTVNAVKGDIYNILPSTAQIKAGRTAAGGYTPSTFTLTCGYTRKSIDGSTTSVTDVTGAFGGYNLYFRKRTRSTQSWSLYFKYTAYKNNSDHRYSLTNFPLSTYDAVEFIICNSNEATITASALSGYQVIDIETVPVAADGMQGDNAVRYYLVINPESLALAAGGDRFNDGTAAKDIDVSVYKQVGYQTPALATVGEFRVSFTVTTVNGQSTTYQQAQNHFVIEAIPVSIARIGFVLTDSAGSVEYDARTLNVQAAGRRGYQGPTPRRREWVTPIDDADIHAITYQSGTTDLNGNPEAYKDFVLIKDAQGGIHQFECIQTYTVKASNADATCPLLPSGEHGDDWDEDTRSGVHWKEATEDFDFVTTNILLSQYILAESGAFDGLHVNFLHILRNSYIGGFTFNEPYRVPASEVKICVNPLNYGKTDFALWSSLSQSVISHAGYDLVGDYGDSIYKSANILFPDCGSSVIVDDDTLNGRIFEVNTLNGKSGDFSSDARYLYLSLPFYAPFPLQVEYGTNGFYRYSMENAAGVLSSGAGPYTQYILPSSDDYDAATKQIMDQLTRAEAMCHEYLGARITVQNAVSLPSGAEGQTNIVIHGVKGLRRCKQFTPGPSLSGCVQSYEELDPWGRTSFFWQLRGQGQTPGVLQYISDKAALSTFDAVRYLQNGSSYWFVSPSELRPTLIGFNSNIAVVGHSTQVQLGTGFGFDMDMGWDPGFDTTRLYNCRAYLFSRVYDPSAGRGGEWLDPLAQTNEGILSAMELLPGEFCTLEMTYEEGEYFWQIINHGPIPGYNPLGNS